MTRKLIATILAAALAVTTMNATAVQASDRDVAKIIVGATALAIIGSAIANEQRKQNQQPHYSSQGPRHQPQYNRYDNDRHHKRYDDNRYGQRHHKKNWNQTRYKPTVSSQCLTNVRGANGWTQGYGVRCAQNSTRAALPSNCVRRNFARGPNLYYSPVCLRQNGFNA